MPAAVEAVVRSILAGASPVTDIVGDKIRHGQIGHDEAHPSVVFSAESAEETQSLGDSDTGGHTGQRVSYVDVETRSGDPIEVTTLTEAVIDAMLAVSPNGAQTVAATVVQAIEVERGPQDLDTVPGRGRDQSIRGKSTIFAVWHER